MKKSFVLVAAVLALGSTSAGAEQEATYSIPPPVVTSEADRALARMGALLQEAKSLSFEAEVTYDILLGDGQMVLYGSQVEAAWRPGKSLKIRIDGDERKNRIYIDEGSVTFVDDEVGIYATNQVPGSLDDAIDDVLARLGLEIPLAEIFYVDPYRLFRDTAVWGRQVGIHEVDGIECHHLAFVANGLDWQVWIDTGDKPLLRKLVIDYRDRVGSPSYTARITKWKVNPRLSKNFARFQPDEESAAEFMLWAGAKAGGKR
jgi:hypothetical protein